MHVLDNGICVTCQPAHVLVNGECVTCSTSRSFTPALHPHDPHSGKFVHTPGSGFGKGLGGGSNHGVAKKLLAAIDEGDDEEILKQGELLDKSTFDALTPRERKDIIDEFDGTAKGKAVPKDQRDRAKKILEKLHSKGGSNEPKPAKTVPAPKAPAARPAKRAVGKDRIAEVTPDNVPRGVSYPVDKQLTAIAKLQGFDGHPRLEDAGGFDRAVSDGWIEMWRGVQDSSEGKTARDIADDLKTGPWDLGTGVYGNGVYTSVRRGTAEIYRGATEAGLDRYKGGADGGLIRLALDPKARVIDFDDLIDEMDADRRISPTGDPFMASVLADPGRYAAAKGYDAVKVSGPQAYGDGTPYPNGEQAADQYIILNRTTLIVQKEDPA